jgi:hypothetical protein
MLPRHTGEGEQAADGPQGEERRAEHGHREAGVPNSLSMPLHPAGQMPQQRREDDREDPAEDALPSPP